MDPNYIDRRIKDELEGLEANPPVEAWAGISEALVLRRKRSVFYMLSGLAASIAILALSMISYWMLTGGYEVTAPAFTDTGTPEIIRPAGTAGSLTSLPAEDDMRYLVSLDTEAETGSRSESVARIVAQNVDYRLAGISPDILNRYPGGEQQIMSVAFGGPDKPYTERISDYFAGVRGSAPNTIRLGAHFAPQSSYRIYSGGIDAVSQGIPYESLEEGILSLGAGVSAYFKFAPGWSLQTGLNYFRTGQFIKDIVSYNHPASLPLYSQERTTGRVFHPQTILTSQGSVRMFDPYHYYADVRSSRVITSKEGFEGTEIRTLKRSGEGVSQVFSYLEMPVVFRYNLLGKGIGLHVKGGVSGIYMVGNDVYLGSNIYQSPVGETYGVRRINFSAIGGISIEVPLTNRLHLHLEPTAQLFLNPAIREGMMMGNAYPFGYSLITGVSYGF